MNLLTQLGDMSVVVADTGNLDAIQEFNPQEATTNPSLVTAELSDPARLESLKSAVNQFSNISDAMRYLTVSLGAQISGQIPGRVSTEVDASLSYDTEATYAEAHKILAIYDEMGIQPNRVLIKIAATWQGIQAAKKLEEQGVGCNLTLIFGLEQAKACSDAGVTLISPFVGRLLDWQKKTSGVDTVPLTDDLGVNSVKSIFNLYKSTGITTQVMGASFRSIEQICALAGCDFLTIAPSLLQELSTTERHLERQLYLDQAQSERAAAISQSDFDEQMALNKAAHELLAAGIEGFSAAQKQLAQKLKSL